MARCLTRNKFNKMHAKTTIKENEERPKIAKDREERRKFTRKK